MTSAKNVVELERERNSKICEDFAFLRFGRSNRFAVLVFGRSLELSLSVQVSLNEPLIPATLAPKPTLSFETHYFLVESTAVRGI
jgi:hypothetical protein